jgi:chromosome segregation ATPase
MKRHLIQLDDSEAVPTTPARERLAHLLKAKEAAAAEVREVQARIARLAELAKVADPIRAKLAELESAEATRFAEWAKGDAGVPVPPADSTARTDLQRELADAQSRADAANRAIAAMSHETAEANAKSAAADKALPMAAAVVALEELAPIVEAARIAVAKDQRDANEGPDPVERNARRVIGTGRTARWPSGVHGRLRRGQQSRQ